MQDFYVYILKCADGSYYIGHTDNIHKRLSQYEEGQGCSYTRNRLPFEVMAIMPCASRMAALVFEQKIKRWSRVKKEALIRRDWEKVSLLGKKEFNEKS